MRPIIEGLHNCKYCRYMKCNSSHTVGYSWYGGTCTCPEDADGDGSPISADLTHQPSMRTEPVIFRDKQINDWSQNLDGWHHISGAVVTYHTDYHGAWYEPTVPDEEEGWGTSYGTLTEAMAAVDEWYAKAEVV